MAVKELNTKEQHYADTRDEAEEIVTEAKEDMFLTKWGINEKHNKYGTYFVVDLTFHFDTPKEIMESAPAKDDEIEEPHDGIPYSVNQDGTAAVKQNEEDE
ncbi:organic solvent tolerance protein OstA [Sediminibacillus sp. JSM 1682029]|uniref:organic solvent tolerance protein OstA n=1 Tax=Sediminibacillus sp. JSM 1682029 TaxID=3229857 RepID=UPI00352616B3